MTVEVAVGMVLGAAQTLFAALQCKELKEFYSKFKYDSQLEALRGTVETIQKVLLDADSRHLELNNQGLEWVNKLKDAVYEADDLFDKFATVAQQHKRMPGSKIPKKVHAFFSSENQLLFRFRTCNEIKEIRKKLDGVAKDHTQFGFSDVYRPVKRKEETWSYVHQDSIIGRDTDKEEIMGMLLRESDSSVDSVSFVSIVGMAGLGKTALAQLVYNDVRINDEFDLKLWVCVSDDFIMQEILCKMLKSATEQDHGDIGAEGVQNKVRHCIEGKKYFLIPDDLWNESRDEWLKLRDFLQVGARGSRVVVTTRSERVAGAIGDYPMFRLRGLSDDYSWRLFKRVAFNLGSREIDDDLVDLGSCKMHDLIHDLAQEIAGKESYLMEDTSKSPFDRKSRHLAILVRRSLVLSPSDTFSKLSGLRTLLRHHWLECESHVSTILANCRRLRVLDLHKLKIKALTSTIKNLLHLSMTGLRTLTRFVFGPESSKKGQTGQLRDLVPLINLRGTLEVSFKEGYTYDSMNSEEEASASNESTPASESSSSCRYSNVELMESDNNVALSFPSLDQLLLDGCPRLKSFPRCPRLKGLSLRDLNEAFTFCEQRDDEANATTPAASSFSASSSSGSNDNHSAGVDVFDLRDLKTDNLGLIKSLFGESIRSIDKLRLRHMEVESLSSVEEEYHRKYAFSIRSLQFESCRNLKSLSGIEHLTNLKSLCIEYCPNLELEEEKGFPWKDLHALSNLNLFGLPQLIDLPKGIQYLTSLQSLCIKDCENMKPTRSGFIAPSLCGHFLLLVLRN
uniref:Uncharacterized protein n=2 Tax=Chenopodium quinoa TaxID=63459 RepID=A0A803NEP1_CHEQI